MRKWAIPVVSSSCFSQSNRQDDSGAPLLAVLISEFTRIFQSGAGPSG